MQSVLPPIVLGGYSGMRERVHQNCKGNDIVTFVNTPDGVIHFEDLVPGTYGPFGGYTVDAQEIIAFARQFDPQPMHLDDEAAKKTLVGGLCASGFHTCSILMRLLCDVFLLKSSSLGSPGVDEGKWFQPVRPGDTLALRLNVLSGRILQSRPDVGIYKMVFDLLDARGVTVASITTNQLLRLRHAATANPSTIRNKPVDLKSNHWDEPLSANTELRGDYFEDMRVGDLRDIGSHTFERNEIIDFARRFDPQPFHLDETAAKSSLFGGLAASGWHTASTFIRLNVLARQAHQAALLQAGAPSAAWGPSPGFRSMLWPKPVLAGDTINFRNKIIELRPLKSRPERGLVISDAQGRNQRGEICYRFTGQMFVERRTAGRDD
jgi:acyl dehydratase